VVRLASDGSFTRVRISRGRIVGFTDKVKVTLEQATEALMGSGGIVTLSLTSELDGGGWSNPRPGRFTPGKDPVPIV
jgi:hypothetical protein